MKALAWGRLLRLSLAPSAAADVAAGLCLGAWGRFPLRRESLLLVLASLCVYQGGMALNDWADRAGDARTRPERPIPSGAVSAPSALIVALLLLAAGPALALLADRTLAVWMAVVAVLAALYDLAGRGPWTGPSLLGLCRGMNLGAGVLLGARLTGEALPDAPRWAWAACLLYGAYVFFASRLGRLEDDEDEGALARRPSAYLRLAALCLISLPVIPWVLRQPSLAREPGVGFTASGAWVLLVGLVGILLAALGASGLLRRATETTWSRALVGRSTGMALRRLLVFTAVCAWCSLLPLAQARAALGIQGLSGLVVAGLILLGYPLSFALRRVFPPT